MIIVILAAALVLIVPLVSGSYAGMLELRVRGSWLVVGAIGVQIAIISVLDLGSGPVPRALHVVTYAAIGVCIWLNRSTRWLPVIGVGWLSNFIAIVANGGVMPTSDAAANAVGRAASSSFENSTPLASPRLVFLGDIIVTPQQLPFANVLSIGDVVLLVGFLLVLVAASRTHSRAAATA